MQRKRNSSNHQKSIERSCKVYFADNIKMGKLVVFWSPFAGQSKVTSTMCAVAGAIGITYPNLELALTHAQMDSMELEERLDFRPGASDKKELYEKTGIAALQLNYMQAALTSEKIRSCAIPLLMKSLYLFPGSGRQEIKEDVQFQILTEKLVDEFDLTFLDLKSGISDSSNKLLQIADGVVVVLPQREVCWDKLLENSMEMLTGKKVCLVIGGYLKNSRYSLDFFKRKKNIKGKDYFLGAVSMNTAYMDAMEAGRCLEFFLKNELVERKEENYEFISQTKRIAEYIKTELLVS